MNRSLADRTKAFALRIIRLYSALPKRDVVRVIARQMLRSGTSVGAHGREAFRSRSNAELVSKMEMALQELDETMYWLELLVESGNVAPSRLSALMAEANELAAILVSSVKTIKSRRR